MTNNRIGSVDLLRFIACSSVLLYHLCYRLPGYAHDLTAWGLFGVEVFFVVSGFVIPYSMYKSVYVFPRDAGMFVLRRLVRLDPPYFVCSALALFVAFLIGRSGVSGGSAFSFDWPQALLHIGYFNGVYGYEWYNPVSWTLGIEFQYYLVMSIVFPLCLVPWTRIMLILVGLGVTCVTFFYFGYPRDAQSPWLWKWLPIFLMGVSCFTYKTGKIGRYEFWGWLALCALVGLGCSRQWGVVFGVGAALCIAHFDYNPTRLVVYLSDRTYSIYLVHSIVGTKFIKFFSRYSDYSYWGVGAFAGGLFVTFISAHYIHKYVEVPSLRWATKLKYSRVLI